MRAGRCPFTATPGIPKRVPVNSGVPHERAPVGEATIDAFVAATGVKAGGVKDNKVLRDWLAISLSVYCFALNLRVYLLWPSCTRFAGYPPSQ